MSQAEDFSQVPPPLPSGDQVGEPDAPANADTPSAAAQAEADAANVFTEPPFIVPATLAAHLPQGAPGWIPFYRPTAGHQLLPESWYAVRLNEAYTDAKAMLENERRYVRQAAIAAHTMFMYQCAGRQPILILTHFEQDGKVPTEERAIDAAYSRVQHVVPKAGRRVEVRKSTPQETGVLYRIVGRTADMEKLAAKSRPRMHFNTKPHHIEGLSIGHAFLFDGELGVENDKGVLVNDISKSYYPHFTFERQERIISSICCSRQFTLRNANATVDDLFAICKVIQETGATCTVRTHGTIRATLNGAMTRAIFDSIVETFSGWSVFTDTPIEAYAKKQTSEQQKKQSRQPKRTQPPEVMKAAEEGKLIFKIAADHLPHPGDFDAIASAYGGEVLQKVDAKYTEMPMAAIIAIPASEENTKAWEEMCVEPFTICASGMWYATFVRTPVKNKSRK